MPASNLFRRPAFVLVAGLCGIAAVTTLLGRLTSGPATQTKPVVLSDIEGSAAYPAFSADGNRLAYADRELSQGAVFHLFVRRVPTGAVTPLTTGEDTDISPAWSPDGSRIAFLRIHEGKAQLLAIPSGGGAESRIAEFPAADDGQAMPELSWSRDGKSLAAVTGGGENQPAAIALVSVANGSIKRITTPADGADGDWAPAFSPDGSRLAFVRGSSPESEDVYTAAADGGNPQRLTFDGRAVRGLAWSPSGNELIYSAARAGRIRLWRIPSTGGSPHEVIGTDFEARFPTLAANRLAYTANLIVTTIWRGEIKDEPLATAHRPDRDAEEQAPVNARPLIRSNGPERLASYSPDGTRIANISEQSGFDEIWISDADGGNRFQVTNHASEPQHPQLGRPSWSSDGRWLLYDEEGERGQEIWKVEAKKDAKPVRASTEGRSAAWSHDGKSIYYTDRGQIWKLPLAGGGAPESIIPEGRQRGTGGGAAESPDGKFVYYRFRGASIWRVPASGGEAEPVIDADGPIYGDPQVVKGGVYYLVLNRFDRAVVLNYYDLTEKRTKQIYRMPINSFSYTPVFSVSPDGKYVIFARVDQGQTNLMFVDNFK